MIEPSGATVSITQSISGFMKSANLLDGSVDVLGERVVMIQPQLLRGAIWIIGAPMAHSGRVSVNFGLAKRGSKCRLAKRNNSRPSPRSLLAGRPGHGRVRDRAEALGEHITPLARPTIAGDVKPHPPIGVPPCFPMIQPSWPSPAGFLLHGVVECRQQPCPGTAATCPCHRPAGSRHDPGRETRHTPRQRTAGNQNGNVSDNSPSRCSGKTHAVCIHRSLEKTDRVQLGTERSILIGGLAAAAAGGHNPRRSTMIFFAAGR